MRKRLSLAALLVLTIVSFASLAIFQPSGQAQAPEAGASMQEARASDKPLLKISAVPWGPTQETLDAVRQSLPTLPAVQKQLKSTRHRLLTYGFIDSDSKSTAPTPPNRFQAVYYDYTNNRTVIAEGAFDSPAAAKISVTNEQPNPNEEEFKAAVNLIEQDQVLGAALRAGELKPYEPMPPVLQPERANARVERTVYIGLEPNGGGFKHEIVGVNMVREKVVRYKSGAPPTSRATPDGICGISGAGQSSTSNGTAGQYQFTITDASSNVLWEFLAIRPSASSGATSERSGIEFRNVKYRGKTVLKRMHAPILNVHYDRDVCGPFRDWQYQEGMFQAIGTDLPGSNGGFRDCGTNIATTALDSGNDTGNYRGVAYYQQDGEYVFVSELNAGWYRYISEFRFAADGTIRPRYGYGATANSCVCDPHIHHVYWRFDFDIGTPDNNNVTPMSNRGVILGRQYTAERKVYRNVTRPGSWLISNSLTGDGYSLVQNSNDGHAGPNPDYGRGDIWILRYKEIAGNPDEINDPGSGSAANIDAWGCQPDANCAVISENIVNQDIVIWYGAHFYHNDGSNSIERSRPTDFFPYVLSGSHVHGPDIVPYRW